MEVSKILIALLRYEIKGAELCDEVKNAITTEMLHSLYKLSKRHDLAHLVADALEKNGLLPKQLDIKKRFLQERNMAIYRYEQMRYELECISDVFSGAGIPFVALKGSVIRQLYPEPWMRTSCDIDVLVREEELDKAASHLKEELGYTCEAQRTVNELSLYTISGVHLELHYDLSEGNRYGKDVLSNIWRYTREEESDEKYLVLTDAAFYFYHIAHMVKHFENGGCGIRSFLDLWLMNHQVDYDREEVESLLERGGFLAFANACEKLVEAWFGDGVIDELGESLQEYIIEGGAYGSFKNCMGMQQAKRGGKFQYLMSRVFISNSDLKLKSPQVEKRPWLAPFYHVKRWFKPVTNKESGRESMAVISTPVSAAEKKKNEKMLRALGLK